MKRSAPNVAVASAERVAWMSYGTGVVFVEMVVALLNPAALSKQDADTNAITTRNNKKNITARFLI